MRIALTKLGTMHFGATRGWGDGDIQQAADSRQQAAGTGQQIEVRDRRSEVRGQWTGLKLISDIRLLTSEIDDFNDLTI